MHLSAINTFVLVSGAFSILGTVLLGYLALGSYREGKGTQHTRVRRDEDPAHAKCLRQRATIERTAAA